MGTASHQLQPGQIFKPCFQIQIVLHLRRVIEGVGFPHLEIGLIQRDIHGVAELLHSGGKVGIKCLLRHRHIAEAGDEFHVSLRRRQPFKEGNTRFFPLRGGFCRAHSHAPLHDQFFAAVKHRVGHGGDRHLLRGVVGIGHRVGVIEYTGRGRYGDNGIAGAERFRGVAVL